MKRILVTHPCLPQFRTRLAEMAAGRCEFVFKESNWTDAQYRAVLREANVIVGEPKNEDFAYCEQLELLHSPCSGVNYYVEGGKFPSKAMLCNASGCYGNIIAEHMLAMILSLCRSLLEYRDLQRESKWQRIYYDKQLEDCTLLVLGAGDIGTTLAKWMKPMVKKVIGVRRVERPFPGCYDEMITLEKLEEYLPQADIIACALPQTPQTVGLLDEGKLRKMKADAVLVNGGRGSLIDQEALGKLLEEGHFYGVGLEVTTPEPLPADSPLWSKPRVIITPHSAGNTFAQGSALDRKIWEFIMENLARYLRGEEPENQVDFAQGYRRTL